MIMVRCLSLCARNASDDYRIMEVSVKTLKQAKPFKPPKYDASQQVACGVEMVDLYWQQERVAHPIITYADLIETSEPRNLDTANRLHEIYLHCYCGENA